MTRGKVLVTGAAGRLGGFLVPALQSSGWRVRALVHSRPVPAADETVRGDLLDPQALVSAARGVKAVVHGAGVTHARDGGRYAKINVHGTEALVGAAERAGVERLVLVSTHALGEGGGGYSDSKRRAEEVVAACSIPFTIVRLPEVYGAGGEGIDRIIAAARAGRWIPLVGAGSDEVRPARIDEIVDALVRALEVAHAAGKTYTLAGHALTIREVAEASTAAFGSDSRLVFLPEQLVRLAGQLSRAFPLPLYPDQVTRLRARRPEPSGEAEAELGFRPRPFAEGIRGAGMAVPDILWTD
jgi:nucleoside-diphosphate-sugar epimerase